MTTDRDILARIVAAWDTFSVLDAEFAALITEAREALAQQPTTTRDRLETLTKAVVDALMSEETGDGYYRWQYENIVRSAILAAAPDLSRDAEVARRPGCAHYCEDGHVTADEAVQWDMEIIGLRAEVARYRNAVVSLSSNLAYMHGYSDHAGDWFDCPRYPCDNSRAMTAALQAPTTPAEDAGSRPTIRIGGHITVRLDECCDAFVVATPGGDGTLPVIEVAHPIVIATAEASR